MAWDRKERLEALIKEKVAIIVLERLNDPRLGFVTITGVQLSKDKRHAKVLYTVLGTVSQRRTTDRALQDAARHVQEQLAPSLHLRVMPELRFAYDESIEKESRMLDLLADIAAERRAGGSGEEASLADAEDAREGPEGADANGSDPEDEEPSSGDDPRADEEAVDRPDDDDDGEPGEGDSRGDDR